MFLEPSNPSPPRRSTSRGFTLIELVVVVLIIGITAALATPSMVEQMRERRSRDAAQRIALIYSGARMRAMGRGSAVMVKYDSTTGFTVLESIEGTQAEARGKDDCMSAPGLGCLSTQWGTPANSRQVGSFAPADNLTVTGINPAQATQSTINLCFTPMGRSFVSYSGANPTATLAGSVGFTVLRTTGGVSRTVVVLPNGNARVAL